MIHIPLVDPASATARFFRQVRGRGHHADKTSQHPNDDANGAGYQHHHHDGGVQQKKNRIYVRKKSEQSQSIGCKRVGKAFYQRLP
jgi:hypothetical protein